MNRSRCTLLAAGALLLAAAPAQESPEPESKPSCVERNGTFVPAAAVELELDLRSYSGLLEFVEVAAHGALVRDGDVLARFDLEAIDEQIEAAERELRSTEIKHRNAREQARLDAEQADQRLEDAHEALQKAEEALAAWERTEIPLKQRGNELSESSMRDNLADQRDELAQLEKMYTADELTDATEEIVLQRARRQLARSEASFELQQARRRFEAEYSDRLQHEAKRDAVDDARRGLDRLARQVEMEELARDDAQSRLDPELAKAREKVDELRRDREKLTVRAPRGGILLHGARDDYRPGRSAPRHEAGGSATATATLFAIMQPGAFEVALDLPESRVLSLAPGMAAQVKPAAIAGSTLLGRLRFERFPNPKSAGGGENTYDGTVELDAAPPAIVAGMRCKVVIEDGGEEGS